MTAPRKRPVNAALGRFIAPCATLGDFVSIWHHAVILAEVVLGDGVSIGSFTEVGRGTTIGAGSRIGAQVFLPPHTRIGARVFVGPQVMCCDDRHPYVHAADDPPYVPEPPVIEDGAVIGAAAVLLPGVVIGAGAHIAAGAIVTRSVPPGGVVRGEPARAVTLSTAAQESWR